VGDQGEITPSRVRSSEIILGLRASVPQSSTKGLAAHSAANSVAFL